MNVDDPAVVALRFNDCINTQDMSGLAALMSDDHVFTDKEGKAHGPKAFMVKAWTSFFASFPEYQNVFLRVEAGDAEVTMAGYAHWSKDRAHDPCLWRATIHKGLVSHWSVYDDTPENRRKLGII